MLRLSETEPQRFVLVTDKIIYPESLTRYVSLVTLTRFYSVTI